MLLMLSSSTFVVYVAGCTLGNKFPFYLYNDYREIACYLSGFAAKDDVSLTVIFGRKGNPGDTHH